MPVPPFFGRNELVFSLTAIGPMGSAGQRHGCFLVGSAAATLLVTLIIIS